ncbi:MAG: anaerobic ribonucleoside-triphosphate reductase activating protein [bacterium]
MNLAGFVPLSLCDYPGRVAAVIFTQGCNFRCPWCHNGHLLPLTADPSKRVSEEQVLAVLEKRRTRLGGVVISGGEPTLQPALPRFLRCLKALGLDVKLDTNGSHPNVLRQLLADRLLDYVAMDVKAPWHKYATLTGMACCDVASVQASMALIAASGLPHAFRTTRVDPLLSEQEYGDIRMQIPKGSLHTWQAFCPAYSHDPALRSASGKAVAAR